MKIAIQMDNIANINISGDTSFALMLEAQARNYEIYYYTPDKLSLWGQELFAYAHEIKLQDKQNEHFKLAELRKLNLKECDVVLLRQDPPFNMDYITTTYMLEFISKDCLVLNDPFWVRNSPEKLFVMQFAEYMPKTLIARDVKDIEEFQKLYGDIIIKPLYGNGGESVFYLDKDNKNLAALLELFARYYNEPVIAQQFIKEVNQGDKRIILVNGEITGAINRVAQEGEVRSNMHVGGSAMPTVITEEDWIICRRISPWLKERRLYLTGIDVIGGKITEINVTSPTGVREIKEFYDLDVAKIFWDEVEKNLRNFKDQSKL